MLSLHTERRYLTMPYADIYHEFHDQLSLPGRKCEEGWTCPPPHVFFFVVSATVSVQTRIVVSRNNVKWLTWTCQGLFWHWKMALFGAVVGPLGLETEQMSSRLSASHLFVILDQHRYNLPLQTLNQLHQLKGRFTYCIPVTAMVV